MTIITSTAAREVYTVTRLNQAVRRLLEETFPFLVWVEGEVSNLSQPASGHLYFSLKDASAQARCALFRNRAQLLRGLPRNGQQVLVQARIGLYEPRGDFQLIVERLEEAGAGALRRAYDELRLRLEREGLFAAEHKRPLPRFPRRVGVITSTSGAAIQDVLSILRRRFPALPVLVYPVPVQGDGAGAEIARMIELASRRRDCDVLLLVRGGGSLEDLWAFNEEAVARAIRASAIPIVCGVGHETDVTIADFAADLRAPTPSAAAELVSPDRQEWRRQFSAGQDRLLAAIRRRLAAQRQRLIWADQLLARQHPKRRLQDRSQRLDELDQRLRQALRAKLERLTAQTASLRLRLRLQKPTAAVQRRQERRQLLSQRLEAAMRGRLERHAQRLAIASRTLHAVSPLQTLGRGYAIVRRPTGEVIKDAGQAQVGEEVEAVLARGWLRCRVTGSRRQAQQGQ